MELKDRTVLITGGSSGIGKGLAEMFYRFDSQVIITGRNEESLKRLCDNHQGMHYFVMDMLNSENMSLVINDIKSKHPHIDCLINNAGIQRNINFNQETLPDFETLNQEIQTNLSALIWMTSAMLPVLKKNKHASIINISSGLSLVPMIQMPIYCATKAAVHSFTMSLREQLKPVGIHVIEIMPPAVQSKLDPSRQLPQGNEELSVAGLMDTLIQSLIHDEDEIAIGSAHTLRQEAQSNLSQVFHRLNSLSPSN